MILQSLGLEDHIDNSFLNIGPVVWKIELIELSVAYGTCCVRDMNNELKLYRKTVNIFTKNFCYIVSRLGLLILLPENIIPYH